MKLSIVTTGIILNSNGKLTIASGVRKLKSNNVITSQIRKSESVPTSVIFVSKSTETPDFIPYRQADCEVYENQLPDEIIADAKYFTRLVLL